MLASVWKLFSIRNSDNFIFRRPPDSAGGLVNDFVPALKTGKTYLIGLLLYHGLSIRLVTRVDFVQRKIIIITPPESLLFQ